MCQEFNSQGYQSSMVKGEVFDFQNRNGKVDGGEMEGEDGGETRQSGW